MQTTRLLKISLAQNGPPTASAVRKFVQTVRETGLPMEKTHGSIVVRFEATIMRLM